MPSASTQPGNPKQNAYVEPYNRTMRFEWLSQYLFDMLEEVQDFAAVAKKWGIAISLYARDLSVRGIQSQLEEIYGTEVHGPHLGCHRRRETGMVFRWRG